MRDIFKTLVSAFWSLCSLRQLAGVSVPGMRLIWVTSFVPSRAIIPHCRDGPVAIDSEL